MKTLKAYNTEANNQQISPEEGPQYCLGHFQEGQGAHFQVQEAQECHPILDFVNSQCHSSEDLDQALQALQAYQVPCPQDSTMIPERTINHHFTPSGLK